MSYSFSIKNGENITLNNLSMDYCKIHRDSILKLINIIPYITWNEDDLFREDDFFKNKWQYSLVAINNDDEIVGVLIAYFRLADSKHIMDSLYAHRLAIREDYQNLGLVLGFSDISFTSLFVK